ncbi:YicC family protein [candidate division KSB1 bacterium]|nr:YicC family protein [candidate division KSB1 bacterium]
MTGYGRGVFSDNGLEVTVEIKSVNNRFLDVAVKLPRFLSLYEQKVRELVAAHVNRGRISIWINLKGAEEEVNSFAVNHTLLSAYKNLAHEIKEKHDIGGELSLEQIMALPDVITTNAADSDEETWQCTKAAIETALKDLVCMRNREGAEIQKDFIERMNTLTKYVNCVDELSAYGPKQELDKLKDRVKRLITNEQIDEYRLELELALISDKIDVSEECTRFYSHIALFREILENPKSQGRQLNFLLQEMNREANTMASKAYTAEISHAVVKMKEEIEKIREQVQNIE